MAGSVLTPYELLGVNRSDDDLRLRLAYRDRIHELKEDRVNRPFNRKIKPEHFRLVCRAYETLGDHEKRQRYNQTQEWISEIPLTKYTLQQLAAEPDLADELKERLHNATVRKINEQDPDTGHTPLYCAARAGNVDAVYYLADQGAEPDLPQKRGSSALHVSSFYGHPEVVRCMLESGADYRIKNGYGNLAESEAFDDNVRRTFFDLKEDPFVQAAANQLDWFKEKNISEHIDYQYHRQRQTLLHCACKKGHYDLALWLIEASSANLDIVDINLNSALHLAAYGGHASIVKYLLDRGANSILINKWGMTAEQEGMVHKNPISGLFQAMRKRDMFDMASTGKTWWFEYYFSGNLPDSVNKDGATLLYVACRNGQTAVAKWLIENGAKVDLQISSGSRSTALHGAIYHDHFSTVELLLEHNADMTIKNQHNETPFDNARSDKMKEFLRKRCQNLVDEKYLVVHLYGDGKSSGDEALAKIQLHPQATYNDLISAMPLSMREKYNSFTIARRPLVFDGNTTVLSAFCRARYGKTRFIELPLCITTHERARFMHCGHVMSEELPDHNTRGFQTKFSNETKRSTMKIRGQYNQIQEFVVEDLCFAFPVNCAPRDLSINVQYIIKPSFETFNLPECFCLFQMNYSQNDDQLSSMPIVSYRGEINVRLYTRMETTPYWFTSNARHIRIPFIGGTHSLISQVHVIPNVLSIQPDMFIQSSLGKPFTLRSNPVNCRCLKIREHNTKHFPFLAYHGTHVKVIPSILMDGLVMPSTVVSSGSRVCPPPNHIARHVEAFGIPDFSNGIFLSPSIHYCSDPTYAVTFSDEDQRLLAVFECGVKKDYSSHPCTVPGYKPHPDDDINNIEWRFTNPAAIEILSVLFIPIIRSRIAEAKLRAGKLGFDPNAIK